MGEQRKPSVSTLLSGVMVVITIGLLSVNFYQAKTNRDTLRLLSEQQRYSLIKPRLIISREYSRLSENRGSFIIRVKNIGNSPACNLFLAMERPVDTTKHFEFYERWAFIQRRDTTDYPGFEEDYLQPQEIADIKVNIGSMFERELEGKTESEKEVFLIDKNFDLYIYYEDLEGKGYLTYCRAGPHMKHGLKVMGPEDAEFLRKYKTPGFDWKIRFYENVDFADTSGGG
ncbi:MAG: hypothetical protein WBF13_00095 [Candidatus Zixiibacteriota bacterium]